MPSRTELVLKLIHLIFYYIESITLKTCFMKKTLNRIFLPVVKEGFVFEISSIERVEEDESVIAATFPILW